MVFCLCLVCVMLLFVVFDVLVFVVWLFLACGLWIVACAWCLVFGVRCLLIECC